MAKSTQQLKMDYFEEINRPAARLRGIEPVLRNKTEDLLQACLDLSGCTRLLI
jgi:hypothetical protein